MLLKQHDIDDGDEDWQSEFFHLCNDSFPDNEARNCKVRIERENTNVEKSELEEEEEEWKLLNATAGNVKQI